MNSVGLIPSFKKFPGGFKGGDDVIHDAIRSALAGSRHRMSAIPPGHPSIRLHRFVSFLLGVPVVRFEPSREDRYDVLLTTGEAVLWTPHPRVIYLSHMCYGEYRNRLGFRGARGILRFLHLTRLALVQRLHLRGKRVIAVSTFLKDNLEKHGISVDRVIPNSLPATLTRKKASLLPREGFLYAGGYSRLAKGFDMLTRIAERGYPINCLTNMDPGPPLRWIPSVPRKDIFKYYKSHKLLIFPSRYESFGMVCLEAMACGLPVLMAPVGIGQHLQKVIPDFVIEGWDEKALAQYLSRIKKILRNWSFYSRQAARFASNYYPWKDFRAAYLKLFSENDSAPGSPSRGFLIPGYNLGRNNFQSKAPKVSFDRNPHTPARQSAESDFH